MNIRHPISKPLAITGLTLVLVFTLILAAPRIATHFDKQNPLSHVTSCSVLTVHLAPGLTNMRDIGGKKTRDGKIIRKGLVYRSAALNSSRTSQTGEWTIPEQTCRYLENVLGIRTDLDLRNDEEVRGQTASPIGPSVKWRHIHGYAYGKIASAGGRDALLRQLRIFLDENNYPILVHCQAGCDRAGSLAFVLEALLGVSEDDARDDWLYSWIGKEKHRDHFASFDSLLNVIDAYPGKDLQSKATAFVLSLGLTEDDIARLKGILCEDIRDRPRT